MNEQKPADSPGGERIMPVEERESAEFWKRMRDGDLAVQACQTCGHHQYPPLPFCESCRGRSLGWTTSTGQGRVLAATTVYHPPHPAFADQVPYTLCVVQLDDGVRMSAQITHHGEEDPVGRRVKAVGATDEVMRFVIAND